MWYKQSVYIGNRSNRLLLWQAVTLLVPNRFSTQTSVAITLHFFPLLQRGAMLRIFPGLRLL